jgi:hypothetical protein
MSKKQLSQSKQRTGASMRAPFARVGRLLVILVFLTSLVGMQPPETAQAAPAAQAANCGVISLKATADTWMRESAATNNYGSDQSLSVDAFSSSQSALLKWDLSGLPAGATISAASLTLNVIDSYDTSGTNFGLYYVKRDWVEGTNNGASGTGASYTFYGAGANSWTSGGANDTTNDRSSTTMWDATTIALGSQTFALNATGLTAVQNWYSGSLSNYGVTIQNQAGTTQDYLVFDSREGAKPPLLNLTYCVGSPAIGDLVWDDTDGDGIQDAGEMGHAGVTVELRKKSDNSLVATTTTNAAGLFSFSNPASNTYYLQFTAPSGYSFTLADQGSDDTLDSDAGSSGKTGDIVWTSGGTAAVKWDAGLARTCTTVTSRVNASSDDAQQNGTAVTTNGTTLPIASTSLYFGMRFTSVNVPNSATIASAAITFRGAAQSGSNGVRTLYGQAADNPGTFSSSTSNDISGRTRTSASVVWNIASIYASTDFQSYQITPIVQEIVNRAGWAANNAMVILGPTTGTQTRTAISYDDASATAPLLTVTYCAANPIPTITTVGTLSAFTSTPGVPSAAQTYKVSGSNLTADISITAPTGFQISTDGGSNYYSSRTLPQSDGSVGSTTIYVRLNSASEGAFTGSITHTSAGATQKDVAVSGTVAYVYTLTAGNDGRGTVTLDPTGGSYNSGTTVTLTPVPNLGYAFSSWSGTNSGDIIKTGGVYTIVMNESKSVTANFAVVSCTDVSLTAAEDTYLSANDVTFNNGGNTQLHVDATTGTSRRTTLLKWDLSSIPTNATVSSASLSLYVEDASSLVFNLYNMRRAWVEGTGNRTASTTSANWNTYDGAASWGTVGAANTSSDRYDTNLWGAGTSSFSSTGSKTVALNADGVAVVQGWLSGPASNYGLIMQNYSGSTSNAVFFSSSEATTPANRPKLNITYCNAVPKAPVVTSISLSGGSNVVLGWDAVTEDVNNNPTTITEYRVYGSHDPFFEPGVSDLLGTPTPPTGTTFTHTGGSTGTINWYYVVRAVNSVGESANSARRTGRFGFTLVPGS